MNKSLEFVMKQAQKEGYDISSDEIYNFLTDHKVIWRGDMHTSRWWNDCFVVIEIEGKFIGFWDAETTGDDTPRDKGWEFSLSTISEVEPISRTITITTYEAKTEDTNSG